MVQKLRAVSVLRKNELKWFLVKEEQTMAICGMCDLLARIDPQSNVGEHFTHLI